MNNRFFTNGHNDNDMLKNCDLNKQHKLTSLIVSDKEKLEDEEYEQLNHVIPPYKEKSKTLLQDILHYLFCVGWRTFFIWFILNWALYSWEPWRAETPFRYFYLQSYLAYDARTKILWIIAIVLAQVWVGMRYVELKENRHTLFLIIAFCAYGSIYIVHESARKLIKDVYASSSYMIDLHAANHSLYIGVVLLLIGPWIIWRTRDDLYQI